jgi:pimeloyl-ACP methyl ester carboxylesterase
LLTFHLDHDYKLSAFPLLTIASLISFLRAGFFFEQVHPLRALANLNIPVFFIHGEKDDFTPTQMGRYL